MKWLVFSYSLSSKLNTSFRVRIWRKLRKSGAVSPKAGVYVLPYTDECIEAVRWLATEVEQAQGEAIVMQVDHFENMPDDKVIHHFRKQRLADYQEIEGFLSELEQLIGIGQNKLNGKKQNNVVALRRDIGKLKRNIDEVARVDFFQAYDKGHLLERLHQLQKTLVTGNLILLIMFSLSTLNTVVLRKMKEEYQDIPRRELVKIKPCGAIAGGNA